MPREEDGSEEDDEGEEEREQGGKGEEGGRRSWRGRYRGGSCHWMNGLEYGVPMVTN